ncbi:MAG: hypothetical protein IH956_10390, partial [Chloroflexi bacterium]|nr:hypothetical protein [Chloroflexota bacterium]
DGNLFLIWADTRRYVGSSEGNFEIYFAKSTDGGKSFGKNLRINREPTSFTEYTSLQAQFMPSDDTLYVLLRPVQEGPPARVYASTDNAQSFLRYDTGAAPLVQPEVERLRTPISSLGGDRFVFDEQSVLHVFFKATASLWTDQLLKAPDGSQLRMRRSFLYYTKSLDGGVTFSEPIRIYEVATKEARWPAAIAVNQKGVVFLAWTEQAPQLVGNTTLYVTKIETAPE